MHNIIIRSMEVLELPLIVIIIRQSYQQPLIRCHKPPLNYANEA